jgi:type I restriction enzyme S subunit
MIESKPISEILEITKGKKVKVLDYKTENSIPYLLIDTLRGREPEFFTEDKKYTLAEEKDILMVFDGANSGLVGTGLKGAVGSTIARLRLKKDMNTKYITYFLSFNFSNLNQDIKGSAIPHIKPKKLLELNIRYPSLKEQALIVSAIETQFTRLDSAIKSLKTIKEKIQLYRKAVLKKAFEKGEPKTFPEIISKEKHSMKRGPFGGSLKKEIFVPSGYLVYEQNHPINNNFSFGRYFITKEKFEEMKAFSVKPGDLLISCSGTIGKIAEIPKEDFREGIINQALLKITLDNSKVLNNYFIYLFESDIIQKYLTKVSRGVAIKNVPSVKELKEIKFPIPPIGKQVNILSDIESKFSVIDKVEEIVNTSLKKAEMLKKSILKSAFEGRLVRE